MSLNCIELFAGVGGFRVGLERVDKDFFKTIWSNQFEPATKDQHASRVYQARFGKDGHVNKDINLVATNAIPDHDVLLGGFPCQDYSVARTLSQAAGIEGKKGVLWWQIHRILNEKKEKSPQILFLENVDRLINSPATQRGRDFAIILQSLSDLGYVVEWRVINAADYGMPQRRRRTYLLGYKIGSPIEQSITDPTEWIFSEGIFAKAFPVEDYKSLFPLVGSNIKENSTDDLADISADFNKNGKSRAFENAGLMYNGVYYTYKVTPSYHGAYTTLGDILASGKDREYISEDFYISEDALEKWEYLKGSKHEERRTKDGHIFYYNEGGVSFPDSLDKPSRTIITSEGGSTASRFKHVIKDPVNGRLRRLIPLELERLNMFPDNHTIGETDTKRAFFMGNALVCGIVSKVGAEIKSRLVKV